jgi:hypothetical protein
MKLRRISEGKERYGMRQALAHGLLTVLQSEAEKPECVRMALADLNDKDREAFGFNRRLMEFSHHYLRIKSKAEQLAALVELSKQEDLSKHFDLNGIGGSEKDDTQKRVSLLLSAARIYIDREAYIKEAYKKYEEEYKHSCDSYSTENQDRAADLLAQARSEMEHLDPKMTFAYGKEEILLRKEAIEIRNTAGGVVTYHFLYDLGERCEKCAELIGKVALLTENANVRKEMLAEAEEYKKLAKSAIEKGKLLNEIKFSSDEPPIIQFGHGQRKC